MFDSNFSPVIQSNAFLDPNMPTNYAPFGIQTFSNLLYVTYAQQNAEKMDDVAGPGNGFVDVFDLSGKLQKRLISGGLLNSPWGVAMAPPSFSQFAGALLVGNFGDGAINAFNRDTGASANALAAGYASWLQTAFSLPRWKRVKPR